MRKANLPGLNLTRVNPSKTRFKSRWMFPSPSSCGFIWVEHQRKPEHSTRRILRSCVTTPKRTFWRRSGLPLPLSRFQYSVDRTHRHTRRELTFMPSTPLAQKFTSNKPKYPRSPWFLKNGLTMANMRLRTLRQTFKNLAKAAMSTPRHYRINALFSGLLFTLFHVSTMPQLIVPHLPR